MVWAYREARHKWQRIRNPHDKATLNKISTTNQLIKKINNEKFIDFIRTLDTTKETGYLLRKVAIATCKRKEYVSLLKSGTG